MTDNDARPLRSIDGLSHRHGSGLSVDQMQARADAARDRAAPPPPPARRVVTVRVEGSTSPTPRKVAQPPPAADVPPKGARAGKGRGSATKGPARSQSDAPSPPLKAQPTSLTLTGNDLVVLADLLATHPALRPEDNQ